MVSNNQAKYEQKLETEKIQNQHINAENKQAEMRIKYGSKQKREQQNFYSSRMQTMLDGKTSVVETT